MNEHVQQTNGEPEDAREALRKSRELVTVGPSGVQITDLAQQVDYAQTMAKGRASLPTHLRDNIGDCLAVIDISSRAGLSPYMVAQHTYVQQGKLCFESQLYHAFLQSSGLLRGDIEASYEGEGGDRVCIIKGYLRNDPQHPREYRSPALKDRHPGYVLKKSNDDSSTSKSYLTYAQGETLRAAGKIPEGAALHSRGSPLWVTKPDVQQFYDTSRDWTRMFCPRATLGIYTPDEVEEFGPNFARDITPSGSGLSERLRTGKAKGSEGFKEGHAESEINGAKNGAKRVTPETPIEDVGLSEKAVAFLKDNVGVGSLSDLLQFSEAELVEARKMPKAMVKTVQKVIVGLNFQLRIDEPAGADESSSTDAASVSEPAAEGERKPCTVAEWKVYCADWIKRETDHTVIRKRWNDERGLRNSCGITSEDRDPIQADMVARCKELGE